MDFLLLPAKTNDAESTERERITRTRTRIAAHGGGRDHHTPGYRDRTIVGCRDRQITLRSPEPANFGSPGEVLEKAGADQCRQREGHQSDPGFERNPLGLAYNGSLLRRTHSLLPPIRSVNHEVLLRARRAAPELVRATAPNFARRHVRPAEATAPVVGRRPTAPQDLRSA